MISKPLSTAQCLAALVLPVLFWFILLEIPDITVHSECLRWGKPLIPMQRESSVRCAGMVCNVQFHQVYLCTLPAVLRAATSAQQTHSVLVSVP